MHDTYYVTYVICNMYIIDMNEGSRVEGGRTNEGERCGNETEENGGYFLNNWL